VVLIARYYRKPEMVAFLRSRRSELDVFEAAALGDEKRDPALANAVAEDGFGPLGLAAFFDQEPVVRLLRGRGARVDAAAANHMRVMPLHSAAAAHSVPIARVLLAHGAPVNARQGTGDLGFTPLMEAALNGQVEMVDLLLAHGADPALRDEKNLTAADHARERGHAALAARLR
jgi:ankyrin repeat protein